MKQMKLHNIGSMHLDGSIDEVIKDLRSRKKEYSKEYTDLRIYEESCYEGGYEYYLHGDKLETDEEEAFRIKRDEEYKTKQEEYLRQQYETLKAKFENK